jgi:hypothetical protein
LQVILSFRAKRGISLSFFQLSRMEPPERFLGTQRASE